MRRRRVVPRLAAVAVVVGLLVGSAALIWPSSSDESVHVVTTTANSVTLRWRSVPAAEEYRVHVSTDPAMDDASVHEFTTPEATISGLDQGTRYWMQVDVVPRGGATEAIDGGRTISARTTVVQTPMWTREPTTDDHSVSLDWGDVASASRYVVQTSTKEDFAKPQASVVEKSALTAKGLDSGRGYWFRVAVADDEGAASGPWSTPVAAQTVDNAVRAATFNISGVHNDRSGSAPKWRTRRPVIVRQIHDADLDVVGLQEVSTVDSGLYARSLVDGRTQLADVVNGLNDTGGSWKATSTARYATNDTRIVYRTDRLTLVEAGGRKFSSQTKENPRYMAWAVFEVKETGRRFLFVTAHLSPRSASVRERQWKQLVTETAARADGMPVIVGGDFNSSKFHQPAGRMLTAMERAGFGDVLGQRYRSSTASRARAEKLVNANFGSFTDYRRRVGGYGKGRIGNSVDYIFASNDLVVREFRLAGVTSSGTIEGALGSDHLLMIAVVEIA